MRARYLTTLLIAYLVFLPVTLPARHLFGWVGVSDMGVTLGSISGTTWAGSAKSVRYEGMEFDKVRWRIQAHSVLLGRLEYHVRFTGPDANGETRVGLTLLGTKYVKDATVEVAAEQVNPYLPSGTVVLGGDFHLDLATAELENPPVNVDGTLRWKNGSVVSPGEVSLGEMKLTLTPNDSGLAGILEDVEGPLGIRGELMLGPDQEYSIKGTVVPRAAAPAAIKQVLPFLGAPDTQGRYTVDFSGSL